MQGCDTESACGVGIMLREGFCDSFDVLPTRHQTVLPESDPDHKFTIGRVHQTISGRRHWARRISTASWLSHTVAFAEHLVEQAKGVAREAGGGWHRQGAPTRPTLADWMPRGAVPVGNRAADAAADVACLVAVPRP